MGSFYGSVQVRSGDWETVNRVAEKVAGRLEIGCFLGPVLDGWIGIYPEHHGQDITVAEEIVRLLDDYVLYAMVHDSDIMEYFLWRNGELLDSYSSCPDYFDPCDECEIEEKRGRPGVFAEIIPGKIDALENLIKKDRQEIGYFEDERLEEFGELLGISNLMTSYEYLKEGEDDVKDWENFVELSENEIADDIWLEDPPEREEEREALTGDLPESGLLLYEVNARECMPRVGATKTGFAVLWSNSMAPFAAEEKSESYRHNVFEHYKPPWLEPELIDFDLSPQVNRVVFNPLTNVLAAVLGERVIVLDAANWRILREMPESDWAIEAALSADGQLLAHASREKTVITKISSGEVLNTVSGRISGGLVLHPSGKWVVTALPRRTLAITEIDGRKEGEWREIWIVGGELVPMDANLRKDLQRIEDAGGYMKSIEEIVLQAKKLAVAKEQAFARENVMHIREEEAKKASSVARQLQYLRCNRLGQQVNEIPASISFSHDGNLMYCGTTQGFYVYEWEEVVKTDYSRLSPLHAYCSEECDRYGQYRGYIYSIAQEPDGKGVLFAGLAGKILRMDLETGETTLLKIVPLGAAVIQMCFSYDGEYLSLVTRPGLGNDFSDRTDDRITWSIWSYPKMMELQNSN